MKKAAPENTNPRLLWAGWTLTVTDFGTRRYAHPAVPGFFSESEALEILQGSPTLDELAMQSWIALQRLHYSTDPTHLAICAYSRAEAMIAERDKRRAACVAAPAPETPPATAPPK